MTTTGMCLRLVLSNSCHYLRKVQFLQDFNDTIGDFKDLKEKYAFQKAQNDYDLTFSLRGVFIR